jgi:hypothetical protein
LSCENAEKEKATPEEQEQVINVLTYVSISRNIYSSMRFDQMTLMLSEIYFIRVLGITTHKMALVRVLGPSTFPNKSH